MIQIDMEMPKNCKFCPLHDVNPDQCPIRTIYKDDYATSRFTDCPLYKIAEDTDTISRQALCEYALNQKDKSITPNDIMRFPSAQPEKRTEERTETHACDLISRQAAIDAMAKFVPYAIDDDVTRAYTDGLTDAYNLVCQLPSAQPEVLACGEGELIAQPETKRCDTCRHEKSQWFNRCADCFDYELWEGKTNDQDK